MLEITDLHVDFRDRGGALRTAVDGVSLQVQRGETVALVGESGCGKSTTALAVMGLLPPRAASVRGRIAFAGEELVGAGASAWERMRGRRIGMVFQDPMTALNPVLTVGEQIEEVLRRHRRLDRRGARRHAGELLDLVGIADPAQRLREYPHQLSGGMRQRVVIAGAVAGEPELLIADEPTTALDVTVQAQILALLGRLVHDLSMALLLITHDLEVVAGHCRDVHVMYAGRIVECGPTGAVFAAPRHPYTDALLRCAPRLASDPLVDLQTIPGTAADPSSWRSSCAFATRCARAGADCTDDWTDAARPAAAAGAPLCLHPLDGAATGAGSGA
jgi:peptide/nickel transport system ATP-binding protein